MNDAWTTLKQLDDALEKLSPHDRAAWTEWVESRLTERLRIRQESARARCDNQGHDDEEDF